MEEKSGLTGRKGTVHRSLTRALWFCSDSQIASVSRLSTWEWGKSIVHSVMYTLWHASSNKNWFTVPRSEYSIYRRIHSMNSFSKHIPHHTHHMPAPQISDWVRTVACPWLPLPGLTYPTSQPFLVWSSVDPSCGQAYGHLGRMQGGLTLHIGSLSGGLPAQDGWLHCICEIKI